MLHNSFTLVSGRIARVIVWLRFPPLRGVCGRGGIEYGKIKGLGHCMKLEIGLRLWNQGGSLRSQRRCYDSTKPENVPIEQSMALAEARAAHRAVTFTQEMCFFRIQVEGDCLGVIHTLQSQARCNTLYGHVFDDTWRLRSALQSC
ncbi:hypothetical protein SO802_028936 [Lithocarpus litseifolius]|uniref:RNase H type-1 domain-containing protein n=1 Tax=Lithocarpus litseifolius TaxID=425828 RepID=A0AAW2BU61_9ROSI